MSVEIISQAVFERLESISGLPPIAYPNVPFDHHGQPYIQVYILPAETLPVGINTTDRMGGIIQLNPYHKDNTGALPLFDLGQVLIDIFPRNLKLKKSGLTIRFNKTGWMGPLLPEPGWIAVPVSIPYTVII